MAHTLNEVEGIFWHHQNKAVHKTLTSTLAYQACIDVAFDKRRRHLSVHHRYIVFTNPFNIKFLHLMYHNNAYPKGSIYRINLQNLLKNLRHRILAVWNCLF